MKKVSALSLDQWASSSLIDLIKINHDDLNNIVGVLIDNHIYDMRDTIDGKPQEVFLIERTDPQGEDIIRHSMAHILAESLIELFPQVQIVIGPTTATGFFYDIHMDHQLNFDDIHRLEEKMKAIIKTNNIINKTSITTGEGINYFTNHNQIYKVNIIKTIEDPNVTIYSQGNFTDLCRGPHVYSTGVVGEGFKLYNISQVDWNPKSPEEASRIQRIYGYGFESVNGLNQYFVAEEEKKNMIIEK